MGKYEPLGEFLRKQRVDEVPMTFFQIERLMGDKLPPSSRYRAWWSNNPTNSVMTKAWLDAGFRSEKVDLAARKLVFRRVKGKPSHGPRSTESNTSERHPLLGALKGLLRISPGTDVTKPADHEWGER